MTHHDANEKLGCSKLYTTIAVVTFNTLIFIVVGLFILHIIIPYKPVTTTGPQGINAVYSNHFRLDNYQFVSQEEALAVGLDYDTWAQNGHWQVHPWTGLISREFNGAYLNIDDDGVRQTSLPNSDYDEQPPLQIWLFGGSTMFGWGLGDEWTIASSLQVYLQERVPDYQIQVTNLGVPTYTSSQELALFIANLRLQEVPHAIVFMDGLNDVWFAMYDDTQTLLVAILSTAWEAQINEVIQPVEQSWITINRTFPLQRLQQLSKSGAGKVLHELWQAHPNYSFQYTYMGSVEERLSKIINTYQFNRTTLSRLAEDNDILPLFLLQPWEDEYYSAFQEEVQNHRQTVNIANIFETVDTSVNPVYLDDFHYSDFGSRLIAEAIGDELMRRNLLNYVEPNFN